MPRRRRLFRPARQPRRWRGALLACGGALAMLVLAGLGLPAHLLGSAPREQQWQATAARLRIVDGDTLLLGDRALRLRGVLSPARGESCGTAAGIGFDCGAAAAEALARLLRGRDVSCQVRGSDRFGRALGVCQAGGAEANATLIAAGWALAADGADTRLVAAEAAARQARLGLWSHPPGAPRAWRERP
ncbi:thermonuclease family protein [Roseomonas sp. KE0001]|uniref:thermonuclease family protein n=1 Tax=Roseomonas sp. KE0001 TaxID=2479201 RepID=UPI0018DF57E9